MEGIDPKLIEQIVSDAEKLYKELSPDQRWELTINEWQEVEDEIAPTRPSREELKIYLKEIVRRILLKLTDTEARFTRTLLVSIVNQLTLYLVTDLKFQSLVPYRIGIGFLATIVLDAIMESTASYLTSDAPEE